MTDIKQGNVYFIGAGPGDPELLTVKAKGLIEKADLILYAGSLVPDAVLKDAARNAETHNTARMSLYEQIDRISQAVSEGKTVVRLHTGDPSVYSALDEQTRALKERNIGFEVIPGVSSVFAAAAALKLEFTLPEISQTLILTRVEGRTPVPELEKLRDLASHRSSLAIFLSTGMIGKVVAQLKDAGYEEDVPIVVVYRASWPDQAIVRGTLATIETKLKASELTHQGIIIVSPALREERGNLSHLYGDFQDMPKRKKGTAIYVLTQPAFGLGKRLLGLMHDATLFAPPGFISENESNTRLQTYEHGIREALQTGFREYEALICIMASGIVIRELAPVLSSKHHDPAVLVMDAQGKYVISLLSGHEGGANTLAKQIAALIGGQAVITTASDTQNLPALDVMVQTLGWKLGREGDLAAVMAAFVNQKPVSLSFEAGITLPDAIDQLFWKEKKPITADYRPCTAQEEVIVSFHKLTSGTPNKLSLYPPVLCVGIGCNRNTPAHEIMDAITQTFTRNNLALESIAGLASVSNKADEEGLLELAKRQNWSLSFYDHDAILAIEEQFNHSAAPQKAIGVPGVAEPCALLCAKTDTLLINKEKYPNVTVAVALKQGEA